MSDELDQILISSSETDFENRLEQFRVKTMSAARLAGQDSQESRSVADILRNVAERGDEAVAEYTEKFDGVKLRAGQFRVSKDELKAAHKAMDKGVLSSLRLAIENVRKYQTEIFIGKNSRTSRPAGIRYTPIRRVGICVPGASAPLPSTVIMTAVPAQVAGVKEIAVVSPPRYKGTIHPVISGVCYELGITEVYRVGGAQAVGALAFDAGSIPRVDMIVGPGNKYVQHAKKNVSGDYVAIDSIAGPSEVLIIANDQARAAWVAADMLSQAEHGTDSSAIVVTDSESFGRELLGELKRQVAELPRSAEALESLRHFSLIIVTGDIDKAVEAANDFATEHLEVQCGDQSRQVAERITNAGAIFIGPHTPVAVGDYWAGPSHTLPTGGRARFSSAVTSNDFVKSISIIEYNSEQLAAGAEDIIRLAEVEGLDAHARSVRIRRQD
ncbi:MAG: histidinol dehydrogenase [Sedimentisphaerales bacterium]|nr:histidinol dehydrogenase [Sedimentisphaerales bacterium]